MGMMQKRRQQMARIDRVGTDGVNIQNRRPDYNSAKAATKRVSEYKQGRVDPSDGTNDLINRRSQENL